MNKWKKQTSWMLVAIATGFFAAAAVRGDEPAKKSAKANPALAEPVAKKPAGEEASWRRNQLQRSQVQRSQR